MADAVDERFRVPRRPLRHPIDERQFLQPDRLRAFPTPQRRKQLSDRIIDDGLVSPHLVGGKLNAAKFAINSIGPGILHDGALLLAGFFLATALRWEARVSRSPGEVVSHKAFSQASMLMASASESARETLPSSAFTGFSVGVSSHGILSTWIRSLYRLICSSGND